MITIKATKTDIYYTAEVINTRLKNKKQITIAECNEKHGFCNSVKKCIDTYYPRKNYKFYWILRSTIDNTKYFVFK